MKKLQSQGFTAIEALLIIVIVGILAGTGWYVWQKRQETKRLDSISNFAECKADKDSKIQESYPEVCVTKNGKSFTNQDQKVEAKPAEEPEAAKYLEFKEWGVKMKLSEGTSDAYYYLKGEYAYLSLLSLKNIDYCAADETSLGVISRVAKDSINEQTGNPYSKEGVVVGKYAYVETQSQAGCTEDQKYNQIAVEARSAFVADAKTITSL